MPLTGSTPTFSLATSLKSKWGGVRKSWDFAVALGWLDLGEGLFHGQKLSVGKRQVLQIF